MPIWHNRFSKTKTPQHNDKRAPRSHTPDHRYYHHHRHDKDKGKDKVYACACGLSVYNQTRRLLSSRHTRSTRSSSIPRKYRYRSPEVHDRVRGMLGLMDAFERERCLLSERQAMRWVKRAV